VLGVHDHSVHPLEQITRGPAPPPTPFARQHVMGGHDQRAGKAANQAAVELGNRKPLEMDHVTTIPTQPARQTEHVERMLCRLPDGAPVAPAIEANAAGVALRGLHRPVPEAARGELHLSSVAGERSTECVIIRRRVGGGIDDGDPHGWKNYLDRMKAARPARPEVSLCVVNTNGRELLLRCLSSIFDHPPNAAFEVLVLDNASEDGSADAARERLGDRIELIRLKRRRGKAANDSELLERARGRYCLLLNEDSELTAGAADSLREALEAHPRAAAAGAQLLGPDGSPRPCAWRFPGVPAALAGALFAHRWYTVQSKGREVRSVDWAQSAALMVRKDAFRAVGPLDPEFFVYSDEVDWQKRARDLGWEILYVPDARVVHHEQLSRGPAADRRIVEFSRNRDLYVRKHSGPVAALAVRALSSWAYALRALVALALPGQDAHRYLAHAYHSLFPQRGEGLREAAEAFNRERSVP
jgi:N-acetylglucosaminyl-diphospho-decaprenol L-rhamnosyltransferase